MEPRLPLNLIMSSNPKYFINFWRYVFSVMDFLSKLDKIYITQNFQTKIRPKSDKNFRQTFQTNIRENLQKIITQKLDNIFRQHFQTTFLDNIFRQHFQTTFLLDKKLDFRKFLEKNLEKIQKKIRQNLDKIQTKFRQNLDKIQTKFRQNLNKIQIKFR